MERLIIQGTPAEVHTALKIICAAYPNATVAEVLADLSKNNNQKENNNND